MDSERSQLVCEQCQQLQARVATLEAALQRAVDYHEIPVNEYDAKYDSTDDTEDDDWKAGARAALDAPPSPLVEVGRAALKWRQVWHEIYHDCDDCGPAAIPMELCAHHATEAESAYNELMEAGTALLEAQPGVWE